MLYFDVNADEHTGLLPSFFALMLVGVLIEIQTTSWRARGD